MSEHLYLHGRPIASIFELLGRKENDLTYSLGWALAQSPVLRRRIFRYVFDLECPEDVRVRLQKRVKGGGITDIELLTAAHHIVIEAKRGWNVPSVQQFRRYAPRLRKARREHQAFVAMTEASNTVAEMELPRSISGAPVKHVSWRRVQQWAAVKEGSHAEKRLLAQLREYLERVVKMQNQNSNEVYVVSLGSGKPSWSKLTWIEIVEDKGYYFHVLGRSGWPSEPPNYLGL